MRTKNLIIGLVSLLLLVVVLSMSTKSQKPEEPAKPETMVTDTGRGTDSSLEPTRRIALGHPPDTIRGYDIIEIGQGNTPRFSPDSKKIAFLSGGWLCVRNSDGTGITEKITPMRALDFQWMSDSSIIYFNQEGYGTPRILRNIGIVTLKGEQKEAITEPEGTQFEPPIFLPDGTIGYHKHSLVDKTSSFVVIKQGSLPPDSALKQLVPKIKFETPSVMYGDIWLVSIDGSYKRWVTFNKRFGFPEMSPDGKKIIATKIPGKDPDLGGGPYLIDLKGHETYLGDPSRRIPKVDSNGKPVPGRWAGEGSVAAYAKLSPDGSKVVYMYQRTAMDIEDIETSDLVIKNVDGTGRFQIETLNEIEFYPTWSPDGKMIACQTYNTNKIYVFRLK
jgi:Tol biopolymer transport system component